MYYENQCGSCSNFEDPRGGAYDTSRSSYDKGYCSYYSAYYYPTDSSCGHYDCRSSSSGGCYLTTIVCNKLGLKDDCETLQVLRSFRDNVLQKDEKYKKILFEYDTIGPLIAKRLQEEDQEVIKKIYSTYLETIVSDIQKGNYDKAIYTYILMTNLLKDNYAIQSNSHVFSFYDYTEGGHGYFKFKGMKLRDCNSK